MRISFIALYLAPFLALGFSIPEEVEDLNSLFNYDELIQENRNDDANYITIENSSNSVDIENICKAIPNGVIFMKQEEATIDCKSVNSPIAREKRDAIAPPDEGSGDEDVPKEAPQVDEVDTKQVSAENTENIPEEITILPGIVTIKATAPSEAPEREEVDPNLSSPSSDFNNFRPKEKGENDGGTKSIFNTDKANNASDMGAVENQTKASKDTKILVFLFVAVVAVGIAAFGYNFVKKRKQRSSEIARIENGGDKVKNSSNNQGEEMKAMKPLLEQTEKVDLVDEKEETKAGTSTNDKNNPSSSTASDVKT